MVAIMCQMADEEDWMPSAELQAVHKELCETREWMVAVQGQNTPSWPGKEMPASQAPWDPAESQSSELEI